MSKFENGKVLEINENDLQNMSMNHPFTGLLLFYATWSENCQTIKPI